jgi:hypothetical protein
LMEIEKIVDEQNYSWIGAQAGNTILIFPFPSGIPQVESQPRESEIGSSGMEGNQAWTSRQRLELFEHPTK